MENELTDESELDDDEDLNIPKCGVSLAQLKYKIKEEIRENGDAETGVDAEAVLDLTSTKDEKLNRVKVSDEDELECKVAHFLAETSVSRRRSSIKSQNGSMKSACKYKCNQCSALFRYKSTLTYHMRSECGTGVITGSKVVRNSPALCNVCNKKLSSRTSLMVHLRIHTGERPFGCADCGQSFSQNAHLKDHMTRLHSAGPDKMVICRLCNGTFADRAALRSHMDEHAGQQKPHRCELCGKRYQTRERLDTHPCVKTSPSPETKRGLICSACGFSALSRSELRDHLAHHPVPVQCPECSDKFESLASWRKHNRRYHRSRLSKCSFCARQFPSEYDVRVHERSHTGERPYTCSYCGRGFARKSILDVHITLHTGRRDYICTECGVGFNRKSKLDVHMAEHRDTVVQCETCRKTFKCKAYLTTHLKTHLESSASCAACNRSFTSKRGLRSHVERGCPASTTQN